MKIGLFISRCGGLLERTLDLASLAEKFAPIVKTMVVDSFQDSKDIAEIIQIVQAEKLNGVILAGNSPEEYTASRQGDLLLARLEVAGVNSNQIAFANLKQHVARVHLPGPATQNKAELLIRVALARVQEANAVQVSRVAPRKAVAVLGLSVEGWLVAQQLIKRNFRVYLINPYSEQGELPDSLARVKAFVELSPKAHILDNCQVTDLYGWAGDMTLQLEHSDEKSSIDIGAVLVATNNSPVSAEKMRRILHVELDDDQGPFASIAQESRTVETIENGM